MTLTFYSTASPMEQVNKSLSTGVSIAGVLRDVTETENPKIIGLDISTLSNTDKAAVLAANYVYITEFNKYYFIAKHYKRNDKLIDFDLSVDVLQSFSSQILEQFCLIERSENYNSPYINDSMRPSYNFPMVLTKAFSGSFNALHYYLTVASSVETE